MSMISAHVRSAVASVSTSGVLVTTMPARAGRGHVDVVVADRDVGDHLQLGAASMTSRRDLH